MNKKELEKYIRDFGDNVVFLADELENLLDNADDLDDRARYQLESAFNCLVNADIHLEQAKIEVKGAM